jgi:hypothetical protein
VTRILRPASADPSPVFSVGVQGERVFFNDGEGKIWTAPKDGTKTATKLVDDPQDSVRSFVLDHDKILYATRREIRSVPITGGDSVRIADNRAGPILLVSDGANVYHTVFDGSATFRVSIATGRSDRFFAGGKHQTLAVDADNLYIASYFGGTITAVNKTTRRARVLVRNMRHPVRLIVDEHWVYFASEGDGTVRRVPKPGGVVEVLARGQKRQEHLALDATYLYWATRTESGEHAVMRTPARDAPTAPEQVYLGLRSPAGIAVDDGYVYVADRATGEVLRVRKDQ